MDYAGCHDSLEGIIKITYRLSDWQNRRRSFQLYLIIKYVALLFVSRMTDLFINTIIVCNN